MKDYTVKEIQRALRKAGYIEDRTKGSHQIWKQKQGVNIISLPCVTLKPIMAMKLIKEYNLLAYV